MPIGNYHVNLQSQIEIEIEIEIEINYDNSRPTKRSVGARASAEGVSLTSMQRLFNSKRRN